MLKTTPTEYEVVGRHNNHLWLEVLAGGDQGVRVSVPVRHFEYGQDLQEKILNLDVGEVKTFVLKSESEDRPDWRICEIRESNSQMCPPVTA